MFLGFGASGLIGICLSTFFSPVVIAYYRLGNSCSFLAHDSGGCEVPGHGANLWHVVSSQGTVWKDKGAPAAGAAFWENTPHSRKTSTQEGRPKD